MLKFQISKPFNFFIVHFYLAKVRKFLFPWLRNENGGCGNFEGLWDEGKELESSMKRERGQGGGDHMIGDDCLFL